MLVRSSAHGKVYNNPSRGHRHFSGLCRQRRIVVQAITPEKLHQELATALDFKTTQLAFLQARKETGSKFIEVSSTGFGSSRFKETSGNDGGENIDITIRRVEKEVDNLYKAAKGEKEIIIKNSDKVYIDDIPLSSYQECQYI